VASTRPVAARWRRLGRVVLNDGEIRPAAERGTGGAGEALLGAMLRAMSAHTGEDGRVDYRRLRASDEYAAAGERARELAGLALADLPDHATRLAFWINTYNALVLHGIVALGLRRSVWETWNFFGRVSYRVGGAVLSLDAIEHGILRGNARRVLPPWPPFGRRDPRRALVLERVDPRLHFAINCGAHACPPLRVFRPAMLEAQLDLAAASFVNQEVTAGADGRIACSKIFKWYRTDFEGAGGLASFLLRYLDDGPARRAIAAGVPPCRAWRAYSWALAHPPRE
jgi:hypothetical protein